MTDLRKAAAMALKYFEDAYGLEDDEIEIREALRKALPPVKTYSGGIPNYCTDPEREWVSLTDDEILVKQVGEFDVVKFARYIEMVLKEKNCES
jgi:hypothetical protein